MRELVIKFPYNIYYASDIGKQKDLFIVNWAYFDPWILFAYATENRCKSDVYRTLFSYISYGIQNTIPELQNINYIVMFLFLSFYFLYSTFFFLLAINSAKKYFIEKNNE